MKPTVINLLVMDVLSNQEAAFSLHQLDQFFERDVSATLKICTYIFIVRNADKLSAFQKILYLMYPP
ncbi:hypothetical protein B0O44_10385 [Pedobacter nutrimenti]|uniref:Uncharacterized protein n=1 Tax=Pedobacter nutrimenti TaxID=1241337 RepID=A0A318UGM1_9SPHI|nr:hypothetical protein B0O44_10385 [Pedobacter nutrimenti]